MHFISNQNKHVCVCFYVNTVYIKVIDLTNKIETNKSKMIENTMSG